MKWRKSGKRTAPSCCVRSQGVMNGRLWLSASTVTTKSRSDSMVGRRCRGGAGGRGGGGSDIDLDRVAVQFHQLAPRLPPRPCPSAWSATPAVASKPQPTPEAHRQQAPRLGVQRGVPQLLGVHLAQALEAADASSGLRARLPCAACRARRPARPRPAHRSWPPAACRAPARRRGTAAAWRCRRGRARSAWGSGGRTASAAAPGCASRRRRRRSGCRPCRSAGR